MRRLGPTLLLFAAHLAATTALPATASAQATDDATRAAARSLGYEGVSDYQAGNYSAATEKLDRAYRALRVPSLGLWSARSLVKSGRLVAASERYLEVQRLEANSGGDVAVQRQAQADAAAEHEALVARIPSVVIRVEGAPADQTELSVNDTAVPSALIGVKRPVDPGTTRVEARNAGRTETVTVLIGEGETKDVLLRFAPAPSAPPAAGAPAVAAVPPVAATPPPTTASGPASPARDRGASSGSGMRTVGFIALAVGGAGLVAGGVTTGLAMAKKDGIDGCEGTRCPPSAQADVDAYNSLRIISGATLIGGGALAATGLVLILTAPSRAPDSATRGPSLRLAPLVAPGLAGVLAEVRQ